MLSSIKHLAIFIFFKIKTLHRKQGVPTCMSYLVPTMKKKLLFLFKMNNFFIFFCWKNEEKIPFSFVEKMQKTYLAQTAGQVRRSSWPPRSSRYTRRGHCPQPSLGTAPGLLRGRRAAWGQALSVRWYYTFFSNRILFF